MIQILKGYPLKFSSQMALVFGWIEPMIESNMRTDEHEFLWTDAVSMIDVTDITRSYQKLFEKNTEVFISEIDSKVEEILQGLNFLKILH